MRKYLCLACHGLLIGEPVDALAKYLNDETPDGLHFAVVGHLDPQPLQGQIIQMMVRAHEAGAEIIFVGHSKGAMLAFYAADRLKALGIRAPLFVSIDSTGWGSNAPGTLPWMVLPPPLAGRWLVPDNVARWEHFWQPAEPGGGQALLAAGNTTTRLNIHPRSEPHVNLPTVPAVEQLILKAVLDVVQA